MTDFNMAANLYGMYPPSLYYNQVALNDLTDMELYAPGCWYSPMMNPSMSMNGSLFSTVPFTGGYNGGGYDPNSYFQNYEKYQDFMIDSQVRQQQKWREADLTLNSPQEGIQKQAGYLHEKIMRNEQLQIIEAYKNFKQSVQAMYPNSPEDQVANRASKLYQQITGVSLVDDIRQHGRDSFTQGVLQSITFGLADDKTAEENISELTGQPVARSEAMKKVAGNAAGGAVLGGVGAIGLSALWKAKGPIAKFVTKVPVLAAIGAAIAGVIAFANNK